MARKNEVEIQTRLGLRTVDTDKVIYFPRGLAGFEGMHEFILLQIHADTPFLVLQSMDKAHVGLLVADPYTFLEDYKVKVGDAEQKLLRLKDEERDNVAVLVTVSIPEGKPEETSLNLVGPILVNREKRVGMQIPQADSGAVAQYLIHQGKQVHKDGTEVEIENAPSPTAQEKSTEEATQVESE